MQETTLPFEQDLEIGTKVQRKKEGAKRLTCYGFLAKTVSSTTIAMSKSPRSHSTPNQFGAKNSRFSKQLEALYISPKRLQAGCCPFYYRTKAKSGMIWTGKVTIDVVGGRCGKCKKPASSLKQFKTCLKSGPKINCLVAPPCGKKIRLKSGCNNPRPFVQTFNCYRDGCWPRYFSGSLAALFTTHDRRKQ